MKEKNKCIKTGKEVDDPFGNGFDEKKQTVQEKQRTLSAHFV